MKRKIVIPFDAHAHFRTGPILRTVIPYTASICGEAVAMGNLKQPVDDLELLLEYQHEIRDATRVYPWFRPVMTIMLTPKTTVKTIGSCAPYAKVLKFIPANTSTNAQSGISIENLEQYYPILEEVKNQNMIFSIHAERILDDNGQEIPEEERELAALPFVEKIIRDLPGLKIIIEHVSTTAACNLIMSCGDNVAGTITAHHSCFNDLFLYDKQRNIRPDFYCKPVLKSEEHRNFVESVMLSGHPRFFFGSDTAPHPAEMKFHKLPPAAGIFSAPAAILLMIGRFCKTGRMSLLENFLSIYGREFYGLPIPTKRVIISNENPVIIPGTVGDNKIPVLMGGEIMDWRVEMDW